ncbi:MAG TPA: hypothetical protein VFG43_07085 [Geminicoccaceae bacterium]|nr:hypothetical protein [Geminicoccaceae bacterium]
MRDRAGLRRFFTMPAALYADDPNWVHPLLIERMEHLDPRRNVFIERMEIALWLAWRGERCVGRISAQVNPAHLEQHGDAAGQFGFIEAEDDPEVFAALLGRAESWLRERGLACCRGPFNPSINDECGLLVDGFDTPPSVLMGHARPYHGARLEALGYRKAKDLVAYRFDVAADWPPEAARLIRRLERYPSLRVRPIDPKRLDAELEIVRDVFNDAWSGNWGFVPFTAEEARYMWKSIRPLITPEHLLIGEIDGEPAAMVMTLPNLHEVIADLGGRLLPFGWAKLLWRLKVRGVRSARMPLMGVRRRYHGTRKGAALALAVIARAREFHRARGMRTAELSWLLEDNRSILDVVELVGATRYKTYRIYEKPL